MREDDFGRRRPSNLDKTAARILQILREEERRKKQNGSNRAGPVRGDVDAQGPQKQSVNQGTDQLGDEESPWPSRGPSTQRQFQEPLNGRAPRGDVNQMTRTETLGRLAALGQLSEASRASAMDLASKLYLPEETEIDEELQEQFLDAIVADPTTSSASVRWIRPSMTTENPRSREEALRQLAAIQAGIYGYSPPTLQMQPAPPAVGGSFFASTNTISVNPNSSNHSVPLSAFGTTAHEGHHAFQNRLVDDLRSGRMRIDHPLYPLAEILRLSSAFYTPRSSEPVAYYRQPMERHAREIEDPLAAKIRAYWRTLQP